MTYVVVTGDSGVMVARTPRAHNDFVASGVMSCPVTSCLG